MGQRFLLPKARRLTLGQTQPPVHHYTSGISFIKVKKPGSEVDNLLPSAAEVINVWSYTSTPPYTFMVYAGITLLRLCKKHRGFELKYWKCRSLQINDSLNRIVVKTGSVVECDKQCSKGIVIQD